MRVHVYAVGRGVFLFVDVVAIWSDGENLRIQHHQDHITVLPLLTVREIIRIDDDNTPLGWAMRRVEEFYDRLEDAA